MSGGTTRERPPRATPAAAALQTTAALTRRMSPTTTRWRRTSTSAPSRGRRGTSIQGLLHLSTSRTIQHRSIPIPRTTADPTMRQTTSPSPTTRWRSHSVCALGGSGWTMPHQARTPPNKGVVNFVHSPLTAFSNSSTFPFQGAEAEGRSSFFVAISPVRVLS